MKKAVAVVVAGMMLLGAAGCAKKEAVKSNVEQARKFMIEGTVHLKQADAVKAIESFAMAIKTAPDYFEGYYLLAETFIRLKQYPQAMAVLGAAASRFPDNGIVFYLSAVTQEGMGNLGPAIVSARKSVDMFAAKKDEEGVKRATVLLAALVTAAKSQAEAKMVDNALQDAKKAEASAAAVPTIPSLDNASSEPAKL